MVIYTARHWVVKTAWVT